MTTRPTLALSGVIPPVITPLTTSGDVDESALACLVARLVDAGVNGIFVLGTSGEGPWLTAPQRARVVRCAVDAASGRVPVLAGVLEPSTPRTVDAVRLAEESGADAIVITSPYYFEVDPALQIAHVEAVATASALPIVLYNIPSTTHNPIAPATVRRMLEINRVVAIKDSAGVWTDFEVLLALRASRPNFRVFQGAERQAARATLAGADGIVPGLANVAPQLFVRLVAAARANDKKAVYSLQAQIDALWELHTQGFWLECLKYAVSACGFGSGAVAGAISTLPTASKQQIERLVQPYLATEAGRG